MSYSGAIKSNIYGMYLFFSGQEFSVLSWRLTGVLIVGLSLFLFGKMIGKILPKYSLALFYLLFLSDISILFMVRYDWGPVALALSLRLLFIAFWIKGDYSGDRPTKMNSLLLGLIAGVSVYEKLSSIVLIIPLIYILLFNKHRRNLKHLSYASFGYVIGCLPLIALNIYIFLTRNVLLSWKQVNSTSSHFNIPDFIDYFIKYISLGGGTLVKSWITGVKIQVLTNNFETILMISLLLFSTVLFLFYRFKGKFSSLFWISLLSYFTLCIAVFLLPHPRKWVHHWIIGTPFQYIALSCAFAVSLNENAKLILSDLDIRRKLFLAIFVIFFTFRLYSLFSTEKNFSEGYASVKWSPELTRLGEFAAKHQNDALFIAADWGVATQIYCLGDGKTKIYEIFWPHGPVVPVNVSLTEIINNNNLNCVYIVLLEPPRNVNPLRTSEVLPAMKSLYGWKETDIEDEVKFKNICIHKFVKEASKN
jgi:hypothetical protein